MFLKKIFAKKDHRHYIAQGEKYLADERFADARTSFQDALEKMPADAAEERATLEGRLRTINDSLARLNLKEGEGALNGGDAERAREYFTFAFELAVDAQIREMAEKQLGSLSAVSKDSLSKNNKHHHGGGSHCGSCHDTSGGTSQNEEVSAEDSASQLSDDDRFHILTQMLPEDLPARYAAMGEKFAAAYLKIHDGDDAGAFPILEELFRNSPNDVVMYELALIMYRAQRLGDCEGLLKQALAANPRNSLAYFAWVHLCANTGRFPEAIKTLENMLELGLMPHQAKLMLGEVYAASGDREAALGHWSEALAVKATEKAAAERLVPLLGEMGRQQEAQFLAKKYLKGCC